MPNAAIATRPAGGLTGVVVVWWLLLGGAVIWLMPESTVSANQTGTLGRVHQVGLRQLPVSTSRAGHDAFQRGVRTSDEQAIEEAFVVSEWIAVVPGQAVGIVGVDGDAVQIQILDGPYAGRTAWLHARNVTPLP